MFDNMIQMWMICMLVFLSLLEWKPLVKMKMVFHLSLGIKVWNTLFYLPGEFDARASWFFLVTTLEFMEGGLMVALKGSWSLELGMVFGCSAWSGKLVPVAGHVSNFL